MFQGSHRTLVVDGEERPAALREALGEGLESWVEAEVGPGAVVVVEGRERR